MQVYLCIGHIWINSMRYILYRSSSWKLQQFKKKKNWKISLLLCVEIVLKKLILHKYKSFFFSLTTPLPSNDWYFRKYSGIVIVCEVRPVMVDHQIGNDGDNIRLNSSNLFLPTVKRIRFYNYSNIVNVDVNHMVVRHVSYFVVGIEKTIRKNWSSFIKPVSHGKNTMKAITRSAIVGGVRLSASHAVRYRGLSNRSSRCGFFRMSSIVTTF